MTSQEWATIIPAAVALMGAVAAWLRAQSAHNKINTHKQQGHQ